jgi:phthiocerol/phenolphthiocerol synthesis type-I polyketide synthase E
VDDSDSFTAMGGESVHLVHFLSRLSQELEVTVAVADFAPTPTFGNLLAIATAQNGHRQEAVALNQARTGVPLFLAADALGTTAGYRELAARLGADRPVYGLEALAGPPAPQSETVEQIALRQLEVLRRVDPNGPYLIGGWSFGAIVAHDIASQLHRAGANVAALLCLDGYVPDTGGRPLGRDRLLLTSTLRTQWSALAGRGTLGELVRGNPELRERLRSNLRALRRYRPRPAACPVVVFKARADRVTADRLRRRIAPLYERAEVVPVAGDHWGMLREPHVRTLAAGIRRALISC